MAIRVAVTSGKGGVGKTTTVANLGLALAKLGVDVTIVDANFTTPDLSLHFGTPATDKTIHHALAGIIPIEQAVHIHKSGLKIVPASLSLDDLKRADYGNLRKIVENIPGEVVIFDTAAGLGDEMQAVLSVVDKCVLVTNPEWPAITDALKAAIVSESLGASVEGVIINKFKGDKFEPSPSSIESVLDTPVLAIIPNDDSVRASIATKNPVVISSPSSYAAEAYRKLACDIIGVPYKPLHRFSLQRVFDSIFGK